MEQQEKALTPIQEEPHSWFYDNQDKWANKGDHIEFYCPLEEIPEEILEWAKKYEEDQKEEDEALKIYNAMGLNDINNVVDL